MKNYDLGTEKIGRLVRHFSIPCVISMLVAALYNIVDQIFIGWSSDVCSSDLITAKMNDITSLIREVQSMVTML